MRYALLIHEPPEELARRGTSDHEAYMAPYEAYIDRLRQAGVLCGGEGLKRPETATTVTVVEGQRHLHDGPVAHSRDQLGGFLILEVPHLDEAIAWAAECPAATCGRVEIRPLGIEAPE